MWSYALMAAAISLLLCSLGFYVPAVVSDSPALTFHNRFFFRKLSRESDNSVREYRSDISKNIQLQAWICFTIERSCHECFQKKYFVKSKYRRIWSNSLVRRRSIIMISNMRPNWKYLQSLSHTQCIQINQGMFKGLKWKLGTLSVWEAWVLRFLDAQ